MAQTVDPTLAAECVAEYQKIYTGNDLAAIQKAYTSSVSYPTASTLDFLNAAAMVDTIEIKFGVYTPSFVAKYPQAKAGRLTVFLYTNNSKNLGGPPNDVYNLGTQLP